MYVLSSNHMVDPEEMGKILPGFLKAPVPQDSEDDVYEDWVQDSLVPEVREGLIQWNLEVPDGVTDDFGSPVFSWEEARWQDVLMRGMIGVYFQDEYYPASSVRMERIRRILLEQGADEIHSGEYMFYLSYAVYLSLFEDDLLAHLPVDLFVSINSIPRMPGVMRIFIPMGGIQRSGNMAYLPSELSHLYEALIARKAKAEGKNYLPFTQNPEVEDRLGVLSLKKTLVFLRRPRCTRLCPTNASTRIRDGPKRGLN